MTRKPLITCDNCAGPTASSVHAVEAMRSSRANGAPTVCSASTVSTALCLGQQFAMFTDWTRSIFEESKLCPRDWLLVIGLWQLKLNATEIAAAADIQERTAQR